MNRIRLVIIGLVLPLFLASSNNFGPSFSVAAQEPRAIALLDLVKEAEAKTALKEWATAAALWEKVVAENPVNGRYWTSLAGVYYGGKEYRKAIAASEKALELRTGYPFNTAFNIACSYSLLGEKDAAFKWLEKALEMGFRDLNRVRTNEDLKPLHNDARFTKLAALDDVGKMSRDEGWRYDLWFLARELRRIHYDPYKNISKEEFDDYVTSLQTEIPKLSDHQIQTRLMKLMRLMGDGHTSLWVTSPILPLQIYFYKEGWFITAAAPQYADLVGAQILRVGDKPIEQTVAKVDDIISQDNKMWLPRMASGALLRPHLLNGLGLIPSPDKLPLTIKDGSGQTRDISIANEATISPMTLQGGATLPADWAEARQKATLPEPLYLKNRTTNYWFEYLPQQKLVFFQFNTVLNAAGPETIAQFCDRLFKFVNDNEVDKLVIDLRWNGGGNNFLMRPLINGLIRNDKINQRGKLFVIIGRATFSAAMNTAAELERFTNSIFVGEPTGSSPNFVGETVRFQLPYSKLNGAISDLLWESSTAMDYRTWIAPTLYAPPTFEMYRANRDPALEAILAYKN